MKFDEYLYSYGQRALSTKLIFPFTGLDIWIAEGRPRCIAHQVNLRDNEIGPWVKEGPGFKQLDDLKDRNVTGRLRLIYQQWPIETDMTANNILPMAENVLELLMSNFRLPRCWLYDLANKGGVPLRIRWAPDDSSLSLIWQSPLRYSFMSMALTWVATTNTTYGYFGFQARDTAPGLETIRMLEYMPEYADNPLLLPILAAGAWTDYMIHENQWISDELREVQANIGLMRPYLQGDKTLSERMSSIIRQPVRFDVVHGKIVLQHRYLTNSMSEFVENVFTSTTEAMAMLQTKQRSNPQQKQSRITIQNHKSRLASSSAAKSFDRELSDYLDHIRMRAQEGLQHRKRMLDHIMLHLQVLYSLMQQDIAKETKRDSSAMKSISLLTMVFLPGTAIATIIAPFVNVDDATNRMVLSPRFWIFWAIAVPVTVVVIITWVCWLQRAEIARFWLRRSGRDFDLQRVEYDPGEKVR